MGKGLQCRPSATVRTVLILKLNIGIAGGGIGGLAVGVSLRRLGRTVTIYEAASELLQVCYDCSRYAPWLRLFCQVLQVDAGIQTTLNASKHLLRWGVGEHLADLRDNTPCFKVRRWEDGQIIGRIDTQEPHEKYSGPYVQVHRADLQQSVLKVTEFNGVKMHTNPRIVDYDFDTPVVVSPDGQRIEKDLVVMVDGEPQLSTYRRQRNTDSGGGTKSVARPKVKQSCRVGYDFPQALLCSEQPKTCQQSQIILS